jgi:hypothetical protein
MSSSSTMRCSTRGPSCLGAGGTSSAVNVSDAAITANSYLRWAVGAVARSMQQRAARPAAGERGACLPAAAAAAPLIELEASRAERWVTASRPRWGATFGGRGWEQQGPAAGIT